jgi:DNA polymerase-3 subunit delta'
MRWAYVRDHEQLADAVEEMSKLGREQVKGILRLMLSWIRDLMLYGTMTEAAPLVNVDQAEAIQKFVENVPRADLEAMVQLVEEAMELAGRNVQLKLVLMALAHALGRAMHGPHDGTLYVPLAETSELALPG